jgi:hypothetical protein
MIIHRNTLTFALFALVPSIWADSWSPISIGNAPTPRAAHSAVFTRIDGTDQMIVWGGQDSGTLPYANTGGLWKRSTNKWTVTTTDNAPTGRQGHPAVWTGHEMIVWGGDDGEGDTFAKTGGRYDPVQDVWRPTSLTGAPTGRFAHSFIWTGDRLIVWGGAISFGGDTNTGALYDPVADTWTPITTVGAPSARNSHVTLWTGSQMFVWGGISAGNYIADGALYDPRSDIWTPVSSTNAPSPRLYAASGWDSTNVLIWGGVDSRFRPLHDGKLYNLRTGVWKTVSQTNAPSGRLGPTTVWSGKEFLVWGGSDSAGNPIGTGATYNPVQNAWTAMTTVGAPAARSSQTAVWNGSRMIIWGGSGECCNNWFNDGFAYQP